MEEVRRFATARYALQVLGATYGEVEVLMRAPDVPLVAGEKLEELAQAIVERSAVEFEQWVVRSVPWLRQREEGITKQQLMERYGLGLTAVRSTIEAAGLSCQCEQYDRELERRFATVRYWIEVGELKYEQAAAKLNDPSTELLAGDSSEDWVQAIASGRPKGMTRTQLRDKFGMSEKALRETLRCIGLLGEKRFSPEDVKAIRKARRLLQSGQSYREVGRLLGKGDGVGPIASFGMSKRQLMARYGVSLLSVRKTLEACGIGSELRRYDLEQERRFATARYWIQVAGQTYEAVSRRFENGDPLLEGDSPQDWVAALERPSKTRLTKQQLREKLDIGVYPLRVCIWAAGLESRQTTYDVEEVKRIESALRGIRDWGMSFVDVAVLLGKEEGEIPRVKAGCLTKQELQERFGIGLSAVRSTLVMGDLPTKQRLYEPEQ